MLPAGGQEMVGTDRRMVGQPGQPPVYKGDFKMIWQMLQDAQQFYARHGTVNLQIAAALRALQRIHLSKAAS